MGVFTHHFFLLFFPSSYFGTEFESRLLGIDTYLSTSPLGFIINGNFWVNLFILISAYLPACSIMRCTKEDIKEKAGTMILKRYPRLAIPVVFISLFYYFAIKVLNLFDCFYTKDLIEYRFGEYLLHVGIIQFFREDITVIGSFWTLHELLFGVLFAILLSMAAKKENRFMFAVYFFCCAACIVNVNFLAAILGAMLADIVCFERLNELKEKIRLFNGRRMDLVLSLALIVGGIFLGGYPSYESPHNIYRLIGPIADITSSVVLHAFGAFLLLGGLILFHDQSEFSVLSAKPCLFLGRHCMGIYLFHPICMNIIGYPLSGPLILKFNSYLLAVLLDYIIVTVLILLSSILFGYFVERPCERICSRIKA